MLDLFHDYGSLIYKGNELTIYFKGGIDMIKYELYDEKKDDGSFIKLSKNKLKKELKEFGMGFLFLGTVKRGGNTVVRLSYPVTEDGNSVSIVDNIPLV